MSLRVGFLWVAFVLDDYEQATDVKVGLTEQSARQRVAWSI